jgi:hypothetical protein
MGEPAPQVIRRRSINRLAVRLVRQQLVVLVLDRVCTVRVLTGQVVGVDCFVSLPIAFCPSLVALPHSLVIFAAVGLPQTSHDYASWTHVVLGHVERHSIDHPQAYAARGLFVPVLEKCGATLIQNPARRGVHIVRRIEPRMDFARISWFDRVFVSSRGVDLEVGVAGGRSRIRNLHPSSVGVAGVSSRRHAASGASQSPAPALLSSPTRWPPPPDIDDQARGRVDFELDPYYANPWKVPSRNLVAPKVT